MFCLSRRRAVSPLQRVSRALQARELASFAAVSVVSLGLCLALFCRPAQAQIASYVDAHGRVIYINANPPAKVVRVPRGAVPAVAPTAKLRSLVSATAERNNMDPALVSAVIQAESNWNPYAVSRKGAFGLMQLLPSTAERYDVRDVFDPAQNIKGGTRYLRDLLDHYHGDLKKSLAAYNAGELAVQRYGGVPRYPETRAYVRKVTRTYFQSGSPRAPQFSVVRQSPIREIAGPGGRMIFTNE